jgi:metal-dependent amidase/aminoacylase/carboxypeptidase family protein
VSAREIASNAINNSRDTLVELSHFVHAHPELGYEEFLSAEAVASAAEQGRRRPAHCLLRRV